VTATVDTRPTLATLPPSGAATRRTITAQLGVALRVAAVSLVVCGLAYPLAVLAVSQVVFRGSADGSLLRRDGTLVGSALLGQDIAGRRYFHPRPSAAGEGYDAMASAGSNLGPSNPELATAVAERAAAYRAENGLAPAAPVPVDAVTASGSGLDPEISPANARLQAARVAAARRMPLALVRRLVDEHTTGRFLGVLGEPGVNVLELDLALDRAQTDR
jgi:K+-transporting ATPase ATPase C chain